MSNMLQTLYDIAMSLISNIGMVWSWLNSPLSLGFYLFGEGFNIFGWNGFIGIPTFVPLYVIGTGALVFIVLWMIKGLVPFLG